MNLLKLILLYLYYIYCYIQSQGGTDEKEDDNEIEDGDKTMTSFIELIEALLTVYKEKWKNGYMIISPVIADMLSDVNEEIIRQQKLNYE